MLTPIELMKATVDAMAARGFGRVVNITSGAVKAPIDVLGLSNGARSGLTGFVAGLARQSRLASRNVTINNLLPGVFDTDRIRATLAGAAAKSGKSIDEVLDARRAHDPGAALRHGRRSSARSAPSCAARRPATSPGRTCCSTAALTRARSSARASRCRAAVRLRRTDRAARERAPAFDSMLLALVPRVRAGDVRAIEQRRARRRGQVTMLWQLTRERPARFASDLGP